MAFDFTGIKWGLSKRVDGTMRLIVDGVLDPEAVINRTNFFKKLGIDFQNTVATVIKHGTEVHQVTNEDRGKIVKETDALVTDEPGITLTVTSADCVPIYFFDPIKKVIGIAHAGWRGTLANITEAVIKKFQSAYGCDASDIKILIGPRIQAHHFEVQNDVASQFSKYAEQIIHQEGKIFIDLGAIIEKQAVACGIKSENIESDAACTVCEKDLYFSYRRDKPEKIEAMVAYIEIVA